MKVAGIIAEYNPFHKGHQYHIEETRKQTGADYVIAVMSGDYVQRGEPAIADKYMRTRMALSGGADLVIEMPVIYATASAEYFATAGIGILDRLGCVDYLSFGSEWADVEDYSSYATLFLEEPEEYRQILQEQLKRGKSFPEARAFTAGKLLFDSKPETAVEFLKEPNHILGLEYIKSILKLNSKIKPYTITRVQSDYNSETIESNICSATAIRKQLKDLNDISSISKVVPNNTFDVLKSKIDDDFYPMFDDNYFEILSSIIIRDKNILNTYFDVNEGIENKIYQSIFTSLTLDDLKESIKSKRYTMTKIKRTLNNILLGITKNDMNKIKNVNNIPYIRILAFNDKGREIIKNIKTNSDINIINKFSNISFSKDDEVFKTLIDYDIKASNIYNLIYYKNNKNLLKGPMDFYISPKYVK